MFCFPDKVKTIHAPALDGEGVFTSMQGAGSGAVLRVSANLNGQTIQKQAILPNNPSNEVCERKMGVLLYRVMEQITGICLPWGVMTGIRPVKYIRTFLAKRHAGRGGGEKCSKRTTFCRTAALLWG